MADEFYQKFSNFIVTWHLGVSLVADKKLQAHISKFKILKNSNMEDMEDRCKETNLLCMNFTKIEHIFVGSTWKRYKNFLIDDANVSGVKKWPLPSVRSKYSNITAN